jgi:hypothetical protein
VVTIRAIGRRRSVVGILWVAMSLGLGATAMSGCQRRDMGRVRGRITFEGGPVPEALVSFQPANRPLASGKTDADGRFVLNTFAKGDGAFVGRCRVTVVPYKEMPVHVARPSMQPGEEKPRPDIPARYRIFDTTPLEAEVVAGKQNVFMFDMQGSVRNK